MRFDLRMTFLLLIAVLSILGMATAAFAVIACTRLIAIGRVTFEQCQSLDVRGAFFDLIAVLVVIANLLLNPPGGGPPPPERKP